MAVPRGCAEAEPSDLEYKLGCPAAATLGIASGRYLPCSGHGATLLGKEQTPEVTGGEKLLLCAQGDSSNCRGFRHLLEKVLLRQQAEPAEIAFVPRHIAFVAACRACAMSGRPESRLCWHEATLEFDLKSNLSYSQQI